MLENYLNLSDRNLLNTSMKSNFHIVSLVTACILSAKLTEVLCSKEWSIFTMDALKFSHSDPQENVQNLEGAKRHTVFLVTL